MCRSSRTTAPQHNTISSQQNNALNSISRASQFNETTKRKTDSIKTKSVTRIGRVEGRRVSHRLATSLPTVSIVQTYHIRRH